MKFEKKRKEMALVFIISKILWDAADFVYFDLIPNGAAAALLLLL